MILKVSIYLMILGFCSGATVDWASVNSKLPAKPGDAGKKVREGLFKQFDVNSNGLLSLAETTKGVRDVIRIQALTDAVPAINRAFHAAKVVASKKGQGADYIERAEFRVFLEKFRQYFEYLQAFERLDVNNDDKLTKDEFTSTSAQALVKKWVSGIKNFEAEYAKIDKNGGGQILFDEFVNWSEASKLDIEDDIEP